MTARAPFKSARAALGWACAVQGHTAGLAQVSTTHGGPSPDRERASSVFACMTRAGLDPHVETPLLEAVKAWATGDAGDLAPGLAAKLDSALRNIGRELTRACLVDATSPPLPPVRWRAIELGGRVRAHATLGPGATDRAQLLHRIERGLEAPERAEVCPAAQTPREALMMGLAADHASGAKTAREVTQAISVGLGVGQRRARQLRRGLGILDRAGR